MKDLKKSEPYTNLVVERRRKEEKDHAEKNAAHRGHSRRP